MIQPTLDLISQFIEQGIQRGFVQQVDRTLDGKNYLADHHIREAIIAKTINDRRITLSKLADELHLEQAVIENRVKALSIDQKWTMVDDLILTEEYINMIKKELTKSIKSNGCMSVVSLAQGLRLPYSLIKSMIIQHLDADNYMQYTTLPDIITTKEYAEDSKASIQSLLTSLDEPYPVFKLQKSMVMPEDLFYLYLEQLVQQENTSLGTLRGKRNRTMFEPKQYGQRQLALIQSIFDSNECITMDTIESLYAFSNPLDMISDSYEEGTFVCLHSCIIKHTVKQRVHDAIESMADYCDVNDILPEGLTFKDVGKVVDLVMEEISNKSKKRIVLDGGYVITSDYMERLVDQSNPYLKSLSRQARQQTKHQVIKLSDSEIIRAFENLGCPHHIAEKILPFKRAAMVKQYAELLKTPYLETGIATSCDPWIKEHKSVTLKKLASLRRSIYFNYQSAQLFQDASAKKSLEKYILKTQCIEFLFHLVIYLVLDQSYNKAEVSQSSSLCITLEDIEKQRIVDAKEQKWVITYFVRENDHKYDKTSVIEIEELLKKKDLPLFITHILVQDKQHLFDEEDLSSEKAKKSAITIIYNQLHSQLKRLCLSSQTAPELLHLISLLLFQKLYKLPLYVSGKFVPAILNQIKPSLSREQQDLLNITHLSIVNNKREEHLNEFRELSQLGNTL